MATVIPRSQTSFSAKRLKSPPPRQQNKAVRTREHLTPEEVERLIIAVRQTGGRVAERNALLILMAYRHGLRVSELAQLRWDQIDLKAGVLHVTRRKNGSPSTHPLRGPELRALRSWRRQQDEMAPHVFTSLRRGPMTVRTVHYVVAEAGRAAGLKFPVHPHMLRHATGFYLANAGQDTRAIQLYLGHKYIQHTARYTELRPERFKDFWHD
jgi:type 1 fimbriae regulatory protein FimE